MDTRDERPVVQDRNYRLSRCAGFSVHDPGGRIGVVEALEYGSRDDRPDALVVRRGLLRRRRLRVAVEQVVEVDLRKRRVVVSGAPAGRVRWRTLPDEAARGHAAAGRVVGIRPDG